MKKITDEMIERALRAFYKHTAVQNFPQAARDQMRAALEAAMEAAPKAEDTH
jgi:hypothetical protein